MPAALNSVRSTESSDATPSGEDTLRLFIEEAPLAIAMFDRDMRYLAASRRWRDDYHIGRQSLIGQSHYEIFPEIDERWRVVHRRSMAGETIRADEDRFVRADGKIQWLRWEVKPWRTNGQAIGGILIFSEDITERKNIEETLRQSKENLEREVSERTSELIEAQRLAHVGNWTWNAQNDTAWWSPEYFKILGLEPSDKVPSFRDQEKYYTAETFEPLKDVVRRLVETGSPYEVPLHAIRPDGSIRQCMARGERMAGRPGFIRGTLADVTELRQLEAERDAFENYKQRVEKSESLGRFAGAVAHHFNNTLASVIGNLDIALAALNEDRPDQQAMRECLTGAMQSATQGSELSRMMLTYLGHRSMTPQRIDLVSVCRESIDLLRVAAPPDVLMIPHLPQPGPMVMADTSMIHDVLTNLLINAWEATGKERNVIRISVRAVAAAQIPAGWRVPVSFAPVDPSYACIDIADTGTGIAAEAMPKLFDPFYSTKFTGRGLGLPVVLGIVQMLKGVITVESRPGKGSTFSVFIPVT